MPRGDGTGPTGTGRKNRQGRGGQGLGRRGGVRAAGPIGYCVCPQCGQREEHERGFPCIEKKCPNCGNYMTRE